MNETKKRGGSRPGAGRPKLPEDKKKRTRQVRLTDKEIFFIQSEPDVQLSILLTDRINQLEYIVEAPMLYPDERSDLKEQIADLKGVLNYLDKARVYQYEL